MKKEKERRTEDKMSKKKTVSTMSLKDFHGGSIPSDLPLPSAPGVLSKSGFDRNTSSNWGNNLMRSDLRPRPKSSGAVHSFDEKASFLSHPAPIGRNFDEDERKPLDGLSAPRRTISDENIGRAFPVRQELKPDYASSVKGFDRPVSSPVAQPPSLGAHSSSVRLGGHIMFQNSQAVNNTKIPGLNSGGGVNNNPPNAWGVRKDEMGADDWGILSASNAPNAESKFAQASALEKVSSGMWQSKSPSQLLPHLVYSEENSVTHSADVNWERSDYGGFHGSRAENSWGAKPSSGTWQSRNNNSHPFSHIPYLAETIVNHGLDVAMERGVYGTSGGGQGTSGGGQAETGWISENGYQAGVRKLPNHCRGESQIHKEEVRTGACGVGLHQQPDMRLGLSKPAKSNFLSRSKQMESEKDYKKGYRQATETVQIGIAPQFIGNLNFPKPELTDTKTVSHPAKRPAGRPKLNLKPRSQPLAKSDGNEERERNSLFGGARPRELVLKERGIDDIAINEPGLSPSTDRAKSPENEVTPEFFAPTAHQGQVINNRGPNRRTGKDAEKEDQLLDHEKTDTERRNWRNDKWKGSRDAKDQRPEPETWRKPVGEPKPTLSDGLGTHQGKLASALELAQAFSKSVSEPKSHDLKSVQKGQIGRNNQVPFSRLTDNREPYSASSTRHRINGY